MLCRYAKINDKPAKTSYLTSPSTNKQSAIIPTAKPRNKTFFALTTLVTFSIDEIAEMLITSSSATAFLIASLLSSEMSFLAIFTTRTLWV